MGSGAADDHFYTLKRRPEDVWRVAVLGDSVTEGFGLAAEQAFPRELERQLEADGLDLVYRWRSRGSTGSRGSFAATTGFPPRW